MSDGPRRGERTRNEQPCPCGSGQPYVSCCMPFLHSKTKPATAEQLMRSRYSAYYFRKVDYLVETTHPDTRKPGLRKELTKMVPQVNWAKLTVLATAKGGREDKVGKVEFIANYFVQGEPFELHEVSRFRRHKGDWKYLDGKGEG
ncbi:hypothetical protein HAHE_14340 [Haloferula helveola]|uniref:YchJ-like middle NTF2-like domain-containing protein n=1 Tax=Haloferula helveola TaxID=490095 RepID=A0ABM7R8T9_9BACT|nr:hypothetical protein HAHE_14340 [Haloferula helveola]